MFVQLDTAKDEQLFASSSWSETTDHQDGSRLLFFSGHYVLSNHFCRQKMFYSSGNYFNSSEQYYMYQKALRHGDEKAAKRVLRARNPKQMKWICKRLDNKSKTVWEKHRVELGIGVHISSKKKEDVNYWCGLNTLGRLLMELRETLDLDLREKLFLL
uniref:NADAR domain-containing protein n=1 Tax=Ditylenchus dipsaci TaxID=166011 RepID=A0A915ET46_9BILA